MVDQVDAVIEKMILIRLQQLKPDEQLIKSIHRMKEVDSLSQNQYAEPVDIKPLERLKLRPEYAPPYESPIEEIFAYNIVKYLDEGVTFKKQESVDTSCGKFRLDFIVTRSGRSIGVECDGEEYHSPLRDEWRDAMILETGPVVAIYRFQGKDIFSNIEDCLFILSICEPQLFLGRGLACLKALASDEARAMILREQLDERDHLFCGYAQYQYKYGISITRHSHNPVSSGTYYLRERAAFAKQIEGEDLDHVMQQFDIERTANRPALIF